MNNQSILREFIRPYIWRDSVLKFWDGLTRGFLFCLIPVLITAFRGFAPGQLFLYLAAILAGLWIKMLRRTEDPLVVVDRLTDSRGEIQTLADLLEKDLNNPYIPLLTDRLKERLEAHPPALCLPGRPGMRVGKLLVILALLTVFLFIPELLLPGESGAMEIIGDASRRLADAAETYPEIAPLAESLDEMEEKLANQDDERTEEGMKELEELSRELTERIKALERNALTGLFDEKGETFADSLDSLARGEMSLPETREFIMDLLSDPALGNQARNSIRESFQDFSEGEGGEQRPSRENQEQLAGELMDSLDPEGRQLSRELQDVLKGFEDLTGNDPEPGGDEERDTKNGGEESDTGRRESRRIGSDGGEILEPDEGLPGRSTTAAGTEPGDAAGDDYSFESFEGEVPEVRLPEGEILERRDRGILRLEGEESFYMERISPDLPAGPGVEEAEIPLESVPEEVRGIVQDYFTSIGAEPED